MTLAFHFVMTTEVLKIKQSDIAKSGFIFSLVMIFIFNLIIVMAVFSPIFQDISFVGFLKSSVNYSREIYQQLYAKILEIVNIATNW